MRGKGQPNTRSSVTSGITPAYAGKRSSAMHRTPWNWDHPRLCGEKGLIEILENGELGSPPPMRGKGTLHQPSCWQIRITPAYAGKSLGSVTCNPVIQDHPRLCGEKAVRLNPLHIVSGSPPPMRGKGKTIGGFHGKWRITPAYAGKRFSGCISEWRVKDHPRLCGEKCLMNVY